VVLLRALESRGVLQSLNGRIAVGWLVVEDLVVVLVLVLLSPRQASLPLSSRGLQASADELAKLEHAVVGNLVVDEESLLSPSHEALGEQQLEMLGDIGLCQTAHIDQLTDRAFSLHQRLQQL
jgi:hypothetical protein